MQDGPQAVLQMSTGDVDTGSGLQLPASTWTDRSRIGAALGSRQEAAAEG